MRERERKRVKETRKETDQQTDGQREREELRKTKSYQIPQQKQLSILIQCADVTIVYI